MNENHHTAHKQWAIKSIAIIIILAIWASFASFEPSPPGRDLIKQDNIWTVAWAGWRQKCGRDLLSFGWTTSNCS